MYSKQYVSHLKSSHVLLFNNMNYLELKPKASWCPPKVAIKFTPDL